MNEDAHSKLWYALADQRAGEWMEKLIEALLTAVEEVRAVDRAWHDDRKLAALDAADALAEIGALCTAGLPDPGDDARGPTPRKSKVAPQDGIAPAGRQSDAEAEEFPGDPIPGLRRNLLKSLRSLHAGDPSEWRTTALPLMTFAGHVTHALAALTGEKEGIAAMFDAADNGHIEDATESLVGLWQITSTLGVQGE
jgi:hypothetical protein